MRDADDAASLLLPFVVLSGDFETKRAAIGLVVRRVYTLDSKKMIVSLCSVKIAQEECQDGLYILCCCV